MNIQQPKKEPIHPADIQAALKKNGITQRQIAKEMNVAPYTVHCVIQGITISRRIADAIADKTGLDIHDMWPGRYKDEAA